MNQYQVDLYDFCNDETAHALKTFCQRVNSSDADVFIIMAHKAVLLFDILQAQGHIFIRATQKVIVSNLALDFDCNYLGGKKVAILDDIVISGTTIASAVNKLKSVGVRQDDIDVIAIAIDQDCFNMSFENSRGVNALHCDFVPQDATCIELSAVISKVFSYYGIPYDIDFPVYEQLPVSEKVLTALHSSLLWTTVDVSNGNQKAGDIGAYTLSPEQPILSRLWSSLGTNLEDCTDIKLRLYIRRYPDGSRECSVVPMCMFKEISRDELSVLYDLLKPTDQSLGISEKEPWNAQMRYLEFYIAHQLFAIFSKLSSLGCGMMLNEDIVMRLFGPVDGETVCHHLRETHPRCDKPPQTFHRVQVDYSEMIREYKKSDIYKNLCKESANWSYGNEYQKGCWINQFILSFFLWWYDTKEIFVRNRLKAQRLHYIEDYPSIQRHLYRLKNGLPMSALRQMLQTLVADFSGKLSPCDASNLSNHEAECAISAFIDRAIDEGIVVPTIHYSEDKAYLCRAFRHGEDLPFGAADQYRLAYFIQSLGKYIKAEGSEAPSVPNISLEKMIVLFYQMGLRGGKIFNRFLGLDETQIIHSFLSIHGQIRGYTNPDVIPHIYSERAPDGERYIYWLTAWLYEAGLINKCPEDADTSVSVKANTIMLDMVEEYLKHNCRSAATEEILRRIDSIAELIATWYNGMAQMSKKVEFRDSITALTSCASRYVYLSAIATEIHYFDNYWKNQAQYAIQATHSSQSIVDRLKDSTENERHTNSITQGLYSGRIKLHWHYSDRAKEVIDEVAKNFLGSTSASVWLQLWSHVDDEPEADSHNLQLYSDMAEAFLYFFSACFDCLQSIDFWDRGVLPQDFATYKDGYLERARRINELDVSLFDAFEELATQGGASLQHKSEQLNILVREALFCSEKCVKEIEKIVQRTDQTYTVSYKSALILDIAALDPSQIEPALLRLWEELPEDEIKTELNIIRFPREEEDRTPFFKYGIFLGHITKRPLDVQPSVGESEPLRHGKYLYTVFEEVCNLLNGRLYQIRGILLPHIVLGSTFNHNLQCNIDKNAGDFYKKVVEPLETCYDSGLKMQLVLGLDRHVDQRFNQALQGKWQIRKLNFPIDHAEWVTNCMVCGKTHIQSNSNPSLIDRLNYSQLMISCGEDEGLGLLMRLSDRVVCLACNHTFISYSEENEPHAFSVCDIDVSFLLRPFTCIHPYQFDNEVLPVQDEVILLEPCWNGDIPFDISTLVSLEDWADPEVDAECKCFGCNSENLMKWVGSLRLRGPIPKGYYQVDADAGQDLKEIQEGFSGGAYVRIDAQGDSKIVGIHEGRFDRLKRGRMIPRAPVQAAIEALFRKDEES